MAEIELSVLNRNVSIVVFQAKPSSSVKQKPGGFTMKQEAGYGQLQFAADDARIKLKHLHPSIHD